MYNNGVTHKTEHNDVNGVRRILRWLSYMPAVKGGDLPILERPLDPWDREVEYEPPCPKTQAIDPRLLITGADGLRGLMDEGSWDEILQPWAQTVIVGRARLGGIPIGVVAVGRTNFGILFTFIFTILILKY
jgi:acetyl-CoA carboxylase/biotin carboxylase 1